MGKTRTSRAHLSARKPGMEEQLNSLESFQALHTELLALSEKRLRAVDRLEALLQAHIQGFKSLLDKKPRSEQSRRSIESGMLPSLLE